MKVTTSFLKYTYEKFKKYAQIVHKFMFPGKITNEHFTLCSKKGGHGKWVLMKSHKKQKYV